MDEDREVLTKVQELSDLELALLLCLAADQHCIIQTKEEGLDALEEELQLVRAIFGLQPFNCMLI